jgi:hypothetical protein
MDIIWQKIVLNQTFVSGGPAPCIRTNNEHKHAYELLISDVIPSFIEWIRKIVSLPFNSPFLDEKPYFNSIYKSGNIIIERLPLNLFLQRTR